MPAPPASLMRRLARERFQHFVLRAPRRYAVPRYERLIDSMCEAICAAWQQWHSLAALAGVTLDGEMGCGARVLGPLWAPLILARAPKEGDWERRRAEVIALALGEAWGAWAASIRAPGPLQETTPVRALAQLTAGLDAAALVNRMALGLGPRRRAMDTGLFLSLTEAFLGCFRRWQAATSIYFSAAGVRFR